MFYTHLEKYVLRHYRKHTAKRKRSDALKSEKYIKMTIGVRDDAERYLPRAWAVSGFVRPLQYVPAEGRKSPQINS